MNSQEYSSVSQIENTEENQDNPPEYQVFWDKNVYIDKKVRVFKAWLNDQMFSDMWSL